MKVRHCQLLEESTVLCEWPVESPTSALQLFVSVESYAGV